MGATMNLKIMTNCELTNRLKNLVQTERKITHLILGHIVEFESRKLYAEQGYDSMFTYLTKSLGYGEDSAYRRLQAARVLKRIPEAAIKIESGVLNLTQLAQVEKCIKADKQNGLIKSTQETQQILEKLESCTSYETKKILAVEFNQPPQVQTRIQPQKDESIRLEVTLTKEQFVELKTAQSLLSHICHSGNLGEVIATLALKFNQTKLGKNNPINESKQMDPVVARQEEPFISSNSKPEKTESVEVLLTQSFLGARKSKRKYISIKTKRNLLQHADHSCDHTSINGKRCSSRYQLQIDHRKPLALGGTDSVENLRVLCRVHNNFEARRLGIDKT